MDLMASKIAEKLDSGGGSDDGLSRASVSHDRGDESPEVKARWFQGLTVQERMDLLCSFTKLALALNPRLLELKNARPASGSFQVLSRP